MNEDLRKGMEGMPDRLRAAGFGRRAARDAMVEIERLMAPFREADSYDGFLPDELEAKDLLSHSYPTLVISSRSWIPNADSAMRCVDNADRIAAFLERSPR